MRVRSFALLSQLNEWMCVCAHSNWIENIDCNKLTHVLFTFSVFVCVHFAHADHHQNMQFTQTVIALTLIRLTTDTRAHTATIDTAAACTFKMVLENFIVTNCNSSMGLYFSWVHFEIGSMYSSASLIVIIRTVLLSNLNKIVIIITWN